MGTISTGTGLMSGMDIAGIVKQLMQIEAKPLDALKTRIVKTQTIQAAYADISARLLSYHSIANRLWQRSTFQARSASSSQPATMTATVENSAPLGNYTFLVRSVVSTHQMASLGFVDHDRTPVGAGTLSFKPVQARVDPRTELSALNGGAGVRRGQIRITDRSGASVDVDLRAAMTVDDVLQAINDQHRVNVRAFLDGDRLVIEDRTQLSSGTLTVSEVGGGGAATDLGIAGTENGSGRIVSAQDLIRLTTSTPLSSLNDNLGLRMLEGQADLVFNLAKGRTFAVDLTAKFSPNTNLGELNGGKGVGAGTIRITNKSGLSKDLQLTGTETIAEIQAMLASDEFNDLDVQISEIDATGLITIKDNGTGTGKLKIEDVSGSIATQLKLAGETTFADRTISGRANYQFTTINSVISKIRYARDGEGQLNNGDFELAVSADGKRLMVIDHTTGEAASSVTSQNGSHALADLGLDGAFQNGTLQGRRIASSINTVQLSTLNGGTGGIRLGTTTFQLRDGNTLSVNFDGAETLQDIINRINENHALSAEVSAGGTGLVITDLTTGSGQFSASGDTATDLRFSGTATGNQLRGGDLNRKYISENTALASLNGGKGIGLTAGDVNSAVSFRITNTAGKSIEVNLKGSVHQNIGDVIQAINVTAGSLGVSAKVNTNGDGIEIYEPEPAGSGRLSISEVGIGTAAAALHIKGEATEGNPAVLTGSFADTIKIEASDTLDDLIAKINSAGTSVRANLINDGSSNTPYRLVLTSTVSGTAGEMAYSETGAGLSLQTTAEARDARVVVGNMNTPHAIVVTSSTNQITGVAPGVTLNLVSASETPVEISITQSTESLVADLKSLVSSYNELFDQIDELTKFDIKTNEKGILLGDNTVLQVRDTLYREVSRMLPSSYSVRSLANVGISLARDGGGRLEFNEQKFQEALRADPIAVEDLFAKRTVITDANGKDRVEYIGIAAHLSQALKQLAINSDSLLSSQKSRLDNQIELFNQRAENLQTLLNLKQDRYYRQFRAMETALANMQSQQSALGQLANLSSTMLASMGGN